MPKKCAIAFFDSKHIKGTVIFSQTCPASDCFMTIDLKGLTPSHKHGFHIHEYGDLTDGCTSTCAHFNPFNTTHGGPKDEQRHVGDLGNIETNSQGCVVAKRRDSMISLFNSKCNIVGRGLVIHADEDDLGRGGDKESLITGNSGKRIACAIIGYRKCS